MLSTGRGERSCRGAFGRQFGKEGCQGVVPAREQSGGQVEKGADVRERPLGSAVGCGMGAALPLRSLLGKAEKMGSSPEACVFYSLETKGGRPYLHIIWVMFRSEACGARNITKLRLC